MLGCWQSRRRFAPMEHGHLIMKCVMGLQHSFLQLFSLFKFWMLCAPSFSNRIYAYGWWTNGNGWAACVQHANQNHCIEAHRQQLMVVSHTLCWFIFQLNFSIWRCSNPRHKMAQKIPHNCACARAARARVLWDAQRPVWSVSLHPYTPNCSTGTSQTRFLKTKCN